VKSAFNWFPQSGTLPDKVVTIGPLVTPCMAGIIPSMKVASTVTVSAKIGETVASRAMRHPKPVTDHRDPELLRHFRIVPSENSMAEPLCNDRYR
jgi:hypothetical protein